MNKTFLRAKLENILPHYGAECIRIDKSTKDNYERNRKFSLARFQVITDIINEIKKQS